MSPGLTWIRVTAGSSVGVDEVHQDHKALRTLYSIPQNPRGFPGIEYVVDTKPNKKKHAENKTSLKGLPGLQD